MQPGSVVQSPGTSCRLGLERGPVYRSGRSRAAGWSPICRGWARPYPPFALMNRLLRAPLEEFLAHALGAAPHRNHLDATLSDLPEHQFAREAGIVQLREHAMHRGSGGRMAKGV